jgi:antitoxin (DNA-binding transcriptional repressor) of toxin-antitoxin stability system
MTTLIETNEDGELAIGASAFKARCLEIFKALEARKLTRVTVTRRGRPVAELKPPAAERPSIWGCHRGSVTMAPGVDLTEPVLDEPLDAELGIYAAVGEVRALAC